VTSLHPIGLYSIAESTGAVAAGNEGHQLEFSELKLPKRKMSWQCTQWKEMEHDLVPCRLVYI